MEIDVNENPYEVLLGRKLTDVELSQVERNLSGFVALLMEIDSDQDFNN